MCSVVTRQTRFSGQRRPARPSVARRHPLSMSAIAVAAVAFLVSTPVRAECTVKSIVDYVKMQQKEIPEQAQRQEWIMEKCDWGIDVTSCTIKKVIKLVEDELAKGDDVDQEEIHSACMS